MADALLAVEGLEAGYGEVQVLWGISLKAGRGQLTAIVGANGAGKTTMLRAIAGTITPWRGQVMFDRRRRDAGFHPRQGGAGLRAGAGRAAAVQRHERRRESRTWGFFKAGGAKLCRPPRSGFRHVSHGLPSGGVRSPARCPAANSRCWRSPAA